MTEDTPFSALGLPEALLETLESLGYETTTPVQAQSIPILQRGQDLLAQAQTGTGKTAAFALPTLCQIDTNIRAPQALVLVPTRELAIQVADAFQRYAQSMPKVNILPIYGGQDYRTQLKALKRGVHIVVGTPGRVMDHMRRGTLRLDGVNTIVLDEADEMLRMGFVEAIEWILEHVPESRQTALFSATMPGPILKIVDHYLTDAERVRIKPKKRTVESIEQRYIRVSRNQKLDALTRFLEFETLQGGVIFVRTKMESSDLAKQLVARGHKAEALNGDMNQSARERVIDHLKTGKLDLIVATDVAARGMDVERITHVINYDMPSDTETYIHRIGRTGRAGRSGKAILFVTPNEQRALREIEQGINAKIDPVEAPSRKDMLAKRNALLAEQVLEKLALGGKLRPYRHMVEHLLIHHELDPIEVATALTALIQDAKPLPKGDITTPKAEPPKKFSKSRGRPPKKPFRGGKKKSSKSRKAAFQ